MTPWMPFDIDMPANNIKAAKRINLIRPEAAGEWWVGYGKSEGCMVEGSANHWHWLAYILMGLVKPEDAPYSERKPLPFDKYWVRKCVKACEGMADPVAEVAALKAANKENNK